MKKLLVFSALLAGCALPRAVLVNDISNQNVIDPKANGMACFRSNISSGTEMDFQIKNLATNKVLFFPATPGKNSIGSHAAATEISGAEEVKEMLSDSVLIFQLPEGEFQFIGALFHKSHTPSSVTKKVESANFWIKKGEMTYLGNFSVTATWHPYVKYLSESSISTLDSLEAMKHQLSLVNAYGIDQMKILKQIVTLKIK